MMRILLTASALACALLLTGPTIAAVKSRPKAQETAAIHRGAIPSVWPAETLMGTIMMVDPAEKLVVIQGPDGVPFDMRVTSATRIRSQNQPLHLRDLSAKTNDKVSVRFLPERKGDVARMSIQVVG